MFIRRFEMPWRTMYEGYAAVGWLVAIAMLVYFWAWADLPGWPFLYLVVLSAGFLTFNGIRTWQLISLRFSLAGKGLFHISMDKLKRIVDQDPNSIWLGRGFDWSNVHTQRVYEIKRGDPRDFYPPRWALKLKERLTGEKVGAASDNPVGAPWIHGVEPKETDVRVPFDNFLGNVFILGTNRCGKTLLMILMLFFAIIRGYQVTFIDPKGDRVVSRAMRAFCKFARRGRDYVHFHLGFPSQSVRLDCLKNYAKPSDLASRVALALPSDSGNAPFVAFFWGVVNSIVLGMHEVGEKPTFVRIRSYVETGVADLLLRVLLSYYDRELPNGWETDVAAFALSRPQSKQTTNQHTIIPRQNLPLLLAYYLHVLVPSNHRCEAVEALNTIYRHDAAHYTKMIASGLPELAKLTTGELASLLSPDPTDINDSRPITDMASLMRAGAVVYIGLDSMANKTLATAVGSMLVADIAAVAAQIYNYETVGQARNYKFLFLDELNVVVSDSAIELTSRGGGAGIITIGATQTTSDLAARLGSEDKARVLLGNFNSLIALRSKDGESQKYVVETFGETYVHLKQGIQGTTSTTEQNVAHFTGSVQERLTETLDDMFPPELMGQMPNWQFIGQFAGGRTVKVRYPIVDYETEEA
jgi:conjugal transfer pilus assembly protein TraD